jgi:hypothetical protein
MDVRSLRAQSFFWAVACCVSVSILTGCGGDAGPSPEPRSSNQAEVAIRVYLGRKFLDEGWDWYGKLGPIAVKHDVAIVPTSLDGSPESRSDVREICSVVFASHHADKVVVRYGRELKEVCS